MIVNRYIFSETTFDSADLGVLAYVMHPVQKTGSYTIAVYRKDKLVGSFAIEVSDKAESSQIDFDLAAYSAEAKESVKSSCGCCDTKGGERSMLPKGYLVFYSSTGVRGYQVKVFKTNSSDSEVEFDSTVLNKGDIFATSLLEPVIYSVENTLTKAKANIEVTFDKKKHKRLFPAEMKPFEVKADKRFEPSTVQLTATQGLVFHVQTKSRIVIKKIKPSNDTTSGKKFNWKKF